MTKKSEMQDVTTNVGTTSIASTSRANTLLPMTPAEKPEKFIGIDVKRWKQKMFFYLTTLSLQRFTSEDAPEVPEGTSDKEHFMIVKAWKHSDFLCRNYILSGLQDDLYNVYSGTKTSKESWGALEQKYKIEDAGIKKFFVARFLNFKMIDSKSVVSQVQELQKIIHDFLVKAVYDPEIHQIDVKTTFLNGELEEEIYMEQPEGCLVPGKENKVCKLVKLLYELKQAPKQWHAKFEQTMLANGFKINECDKCVYIKDTPNHQVIVCLYVDDMLIISRDIFDINATKQIFESKFDMKDLGVADVILGIRIHITLQGLALSQSYYIKNVLDKFKYMEFGIAKTPLDVSFAFRKNKVAPICIHYDSQTAIGRAGSMMYNGKSHHIRRRHNTIKELLSSGIVIVDYVNSKDNISDPFTKGLSREGVERTSRGMGLRPRTSQHGGNST
ncbi:putative phosphoserine aminotransferase, chloroplastic-like [Capsicum annuum]|nr:putative phosphoserine aminotransferase, chloroplastic-like [Capsicum annuum]